MVLLLEGDDCLLVGGGVVWIFVDVIFDVVVVCYIKVFNDGGSVEVVMLLIEMVCIEICVVELVV